MNEIWREIPGYEGRYMVSNTGSVLSLNYRNCNYSRRLVPKCNNSGRLWVELFKNGQRKQFLIHRLVAMAFISNPENYPEVNHIDEDCKNNHVENLEWCSRQYNISYYLERHSADKRVIKNYSEKYSQQNNKKVNQFSKDGKLIRTWTNSRAVYKEKNWSDWSISECCRNKRKTAYGFIWQYAN